MQGGGEFDFLVRGGRIRSPAGEPRRLRQSTGLSLRAAFRIRPQYKKSNSERCWTFCGGGGRIRYICSLREQIKELPPAGWRQTRLHRSLVFDYSNPYLYAKQNSRYRKVSAVLWWGRTDSNHRSDTQQIYSLSPLATRELPHIYLSALEPVDGLEPPTY